MSLRYLSCILLAAVCCVAGCESVASAHGGFGRSRSRVVIRQRAFVQPQRVFVRQRFVSPVQRVYVPQVQQVVVPQAVVVPDCYTTQQLVVPQFQTYGSSLQFQFSTGY